MHCLVCGGDTGFFLLVNIIMAGKSEIDSNVHSSEDSQLEIVVEVYCTLTAMCLP